MKQTRVTHLNLIFVFSILDSKKFSKMSIVMMLFFLLKLLQKSWIVSKIMNAHIERQIIKNDCNFDSRDSIIVRSSSDIIILSLSNFSWAIKKWSSLRHSVTTRKTNFDENFSLICIECVIDVVCSFLKKRDEFWKTMTRCRRKWKRKRSMKLWWNEKRYHFASVTITVFLIDWNFLLVKNTWFLWICSHWDFFFSINLMSWIDWDNFLSFREFEIFVVVHCCSRSKLKKFNKLQRYFLWFNWNILNIFFDQARRIFAFIDFELSWISMK